MFFFNKNIRRVSSEQALSGRSDPIPTAKRHFVNGNPLKGPYPEGFEQAMFGMGCFWGAEKSFWTLPGIFITAVGYSAGHTQNPTYEEVCGGQTEHNEVVFIVFESEVLTYEKLLSDFWEGHDPTQGLRQGNDVGSQYRSGIYCYNEEQAEAAQLSKSSFAKNLSKSGHGEITTEIVEAGEFYFAEAYHQQYLAKNPNGYCGLGGTGVKCMTS